MTAIKIRQFLFTRESGSWFRVYRIGFGLLMLIVCARLFLYGWIDLFWVQPSYRLPYPGFEWVPRLPDFWPYIHVLAIALCACALMCGWRVRIVSALFFILFSWLELYDVSTYLNHYYLISLLALLMIFICGSDQDGRTLRWQRLAFMAQIGFVYIGAAVAKWNVDWLGYGAPLNIWLGRFADWPFIGGVLASNWFALSASWAGMLFDLTIVFWLCWQRTRLFAYCAVVIFHVCTWLWFPIGIFPWLMILNASVFFAPHWPDRFFKSSDDRIAACGHVRGGAKHLSAMGIIVAGLVLQFYFLLRAHLFPGDVHWHEFGFRFSWRVMVMEKVGFLQFYATARDGRVFLIKPEDYLSPLQVKMVATQPDCIQALAEIIRQDFSHRGIALRFLSVDSVVSFNGGKSQEFIDHRYNLLNPSFQDFPQFALRYDRAPAGMQE